MSFKKNLIYMFSVIFVATMFLNAQTPEEKGLEIAIDADERDKGFGDSSSELTMILRNKQGE